MSPSHLPSAYFFKVSSRLKALAVLLSEKNYSDVVRESQEIVELSSKALLRLANIDPPHRHDVAQDLRKVQSHFPDDLQDSIAKLAQANHWLRREREMSFYGAADFDPTEGYDESDALRAFVCAEDAVKTLARALETQS